MQNCSRPCHKRKHAVVLPPVLPLVDSDVVPITYCSYDCRAVDSVWVLSGAGFVTCVESIVSATSHSLAASHDSAVITGQPGIGKRSFRVGNFRLI